MAKLFQKSRSTISEHIKHIYEEKELEEYQTMTKFGNSENSLTKPIYYYNLDVIISVGYRVKSLRGTQFRIWATQRLREYIVKGFAINDNKLALGGNYFDELLERVRTIRTSEKNFYEKVRDTFATSVDYDPKTDYAKDFYSTVQNKFHFAITGLTAAELISNRINYRKPNLGLTNWPGHIITRKEAEIAKNYLAETELKQLKLLVEQFLAFAELQVERKVPMYMLDWKNRLNEFLKLNRMEILTTKGKMSHEDMQKKVKAELSKFNIKKLRVKNRE
ncbi:MAG: virulence RhuM family protein [Candidatus Roizmanbacteria bacterium]|nr:MAG: virulence RhuM family protein [Candidatus Roizmanbacteria bacterium]